MMLRILQRIFLLPLIVAACIIYFLSCTTLGLRCIFFTFQMSQPGSLRIEKLNGSLRDGFSGKNWTYRNSSQQVKLGDIQAKLDWRSLRRGMIGLPHLKLGQVFVQVDQSEPLYLETLSLNATADIKNHDYQLQALNAQGRYASERLSIDVSLAYTLAHLNVHRAHIQWADYQFDIAPTRADYYQWKLKGQPGNLPSAHVTGDLHYDGEQSAQGQILSASIDLPQQATWQLKQASEFVFKPDAIHLSRLFFQQATTQAKFSLMFDWQAKLGAHTDFKLEGNLEQYKMLLPEGLNLQALYELKGQFQQKPGAKPEAHARLNVAAGVLKLDQAQLPTQDTWRFEESHLELDLQENLNVNLDLQGSLNTFVKGKFSIADFSYARKLDQKGLLDLDFEVNNLAWLETWIPDVTSLKASIKGHAKGDGSLRAFKLKLNSNIDHASFTLQRAGLSIRQFKLAMNVEEDTLTLNGQALSGPGYAQFKGAWAYKTLEPAWLEIEGQKFQMFNTKRYHLQVNPKLTLRYLGPRSLEVKGDVTIPEAEINLEEDQNKTVVTSDIVFVDDKPRDSSPSERWHIQPSIYLRLENKVLFKNAGLRAVVGGKIQIEQYAYGFLFGSGRLTIKEGQYKIGGKNFYIHHGRLIFQPVTLLTNPTLDIRLTPKSRAQLLPGEVDEMGLLAHGTVSNPIIETFSQNNLPPSEVLQRLGLAGYMTVFSEGAGGGGDLMEKIKDTLGVDDIDFNMGAGSEGGMSFNSPLENKTTVTVKKRLNHRFRVQLEQSIQQSQETTENSTKAKLDFLLNPNWTLGVETGTQGTGADITYSMEQD